MRAVAILVYGVLVTIAAWVAIGFGNTFAGWGDGATNAHYTSNGALAVIGAYFVALAFAAQSKKKKARLLAIAVALVVLVVGLLAAGGVSNGLFLAVATFALSLPVVLAVIGAPGAKAREEPNQPPEPTR